MPWEDQARCSEHDPEIFFDPSARAERRAKSICAQCPVRKDCLACALACRTEFGVWGGLSGKERASLLRRSLQPLNGRRDLQSVGVIA